ncbi:PilZ domain-containing protein [Magnetospirillum sp. UT-4]|uniref:PilZ domain-containing protein n=1 Tax=Magnetospirillum sp. UT-4 TaxID=2681467 RepID=UPI00138595D2
MLKKPKNERRFDDRHPGTGLHCRMEGFEFEVLDVSLGGMKVPVPEGHRAWKGEVVRFELDSLHWPEMRTAKGSAEVRAVVGDWMALQFVRPSYDLMKMVSRHVATLLWGDRPYGY